jgi:hypothetical protein
MWTSPYAPVEVGGTTLHEMVLEAAARFGDRPALVDGPSGTAVGYRLLAERVRGWRPGWPPGGSGPGPCWRCGRPTCPSGPGWPSVPWPPAGP